MLFFIGKVLQNSMYIKDKELPEEQEFCFRFNILLTKNTIFVFQLVQKICRKNIQKPFQQILPEEFLMIKIPKSILYECCCETGF